MGVEKFRFNRVWINSRLLLLLLLLLFLIFLIFFNLKPPVLRSWERYNIELNGKINSV